MKDEAVEVRLQVLLRNNLVSTFRAVEQWGQRQGAKGSVRAIPQKYGEQNIWRAFQ